MKLRVKTQLARIVFFQATDLSGKIYTDQTGRLPVTSSRGFKYIMVAYDHDSNTINATLQASGNTTREQQYSPSLLIISG